jgi:archaellum component FlaF (FlaF/FlaG flagellin family)
MVGAKLSKGVAEIITTVLLILIVASVGIGMLLFSMGYFSNVTSQRALQYGKDINSLQEHFIIADAMLYNNNTLVNVTVYNYGSASVTISAIYVNVTYATTTSTFINAYDTKSIICGTGFNSSSSGPFSIEVVSSLGTQYETYFNAP